MPVFHWWFAVTARKANTPTAIMPYAAKRCDLGSLICRAGQVG